MKTKLCKYMPCTSCALSQLCKWNVLNDNNWDRAMCFEINIYWWKKWMLLMREIFWSCIECLSVLQGSKTAQPTEQSLERVEQGWRSEHLLFCLREFAGFCCGGFGLALGKDVCEIGNAAVGTIFWENTRVEVVIVSQDVPHGFQGELVGHTQHAWNRWLHGGVVHTVRTRRASVAWLHTTVARTLKRHTNFVIGIE